MGFFKKVGGFFKSVFTDILPPVVLGIAGGPTFGPFLAAAYSGIKTGIETGSPFAGIGSEGYESIKLDRKFIGIELKESYFDEAAKNLRRIEKEKAKSNLF